MKKYSLHIKPLLPRALMLLLLMSGCERQDNEPAGSFDCADCYQQKPEWVRLNVTVTINSENPYVPLKVYVGDIEDGMVDWVDTAYAINYWVDVRPDRYYSVAAEYKEGTSTVFAVDGDKIKLRKNNTDCDAPCFYKVGGYLDARLR